MGQFYTKDHVISGMPDSREKIHHDGFASIGIGGCGEEALGAPSRFNLFYFHTVFGKNLAT